MRNACSYLWIQTTSHKEGSFWFVPNKNPHPLIKALMDIFPMFGACSCLCKWLTKPQHSCQYAAVHLESPFQEQYAEITAKVPVGKSLEDGTPSYITFYLADAWKDFDYYSTLDRFTVLLCHSNLRRLFTAATLIRRKPFLRKKQSVFQQTFS